MQIFTSSSFIQGNPGQEHSKILLFRETAENNLERRNKN